MKTFIKKLLLVIMVFVTVFIYGCSCKEDPSDNPVFPKDKDDVVYMTVKQGELTYDIYKNDMYINMKNTYGTGIIVDWADELILKSIGKKDLYNALFGKNEKFDTYDNTPYWDLVKESDVTALYEEEKFPDGKDGMSDDEIKAREKVFSDNFAVYGYFTEEDILNYYHKKLAKLIISKDYQELIRSSIDFENTQYQNSYLGNYFNEFYMILIPFSSDASYTSTLKNMGISVVSGTAQTAKWVWDDTKVDLTTKEIVDAYIDLYEKSGIYKQNATENSKLVSGVDYTLEDGNYVFDVTNKGKLFASASTVKYFDEDLYDYLSKNFTEYSKDADGSDNSWYWASGYEFDGTYYTALLLKKIDKMPYEEAKPLIREVLLEREIDDDYAESTMLTLRQVFGLMIYDQFLQAGYLSTYGSGSIPELEVDNGNVVVTFKDTLLTKDDLFTLLDKRFGVNTAIELVNYYNALYNKEINDVYDLTKEKATERILNKERWEYAWETAEMEKADFEAGTYLKYGYPASYGWENFLEAIYNVRSTQELAYHYLRENCLYDYIVKKYNINNYGYNSLLWERTYNKMLEIEKDYHYSSAFVINLYYLDENGNRVETSKYSETQKALIKEFYEKIVDYLDEDIENYNDKTNELVEYFNDAGYEIRKENTILFAGINFDKYKTAGINITVENLTSFSYEDLNDVLAPVAKAIWEEDPEGTVLYGKKDGGYDYLEGPKAYFVYVNTSTSRPMVVEDRTLPTFEECATYLQKYLAEEDKEDYGLSEEVIELVEKYYFPIYIEQIGIYATALMFYYDQANYEFNFKLASYNIDTYRKILTINIEDCEDKLEYDLVY